MLHLIVDGKARNDKLLRNKDKLFEWLVDITDALGMQILQGPICVESIWPGEYDGITGVVIISSSHIAVHTWPEAGQYTVNVDVFSCHSFPWENILARIVKDWIMDDHNVKLLTRAPLLGEALYKQDEGMQRCHSTHSPT